MFTKRMVSAKLDQEVLNASETMTLLLFHYGTQAHPKTHAMGNWALNVRKSHKARNYFHARNSIVTVMFNYIGFTIFER